MGISPAVVPLAYLIEYKAGDVRLDRVAQRFGVQNGDALHERLGLSDWIPANWSKVFPEIDPAKVLRRACHFFIDDCVRTQKPTAVPAFNKIKHGLLFVPFAERYHPGLPSVPGVIYRTDDRDGSADQNPVSIYAVRLDEQQIEDRMLAIHAVQHDLRLLAALYVRLRYPRLLASRRLPTDARLFLCDGLADVLTWAPKTSAAPWTPPTP